jgi:hypothetical protein
MAVSCADKTARPFCAVARRVSWRNVAERFSRGLTGNRLRRGAFQERGQSSAAIDNYIDQNKKPPKLFIWTAKANDILEKVIRAQASLNSLRSVRRTPLAPMRAAQRPHRAIGDQNLAKSTGISRRASMGVPLRVAGKNL